MTQTADFALATMLHFTRGARFSLLIPQHPGLAAYSALMRRIMFGTRDIENEPVFERLKAALYSVRLNAVSTTLPLNHSLIWSEERRQELASLAPFVGRLAPGAEEWTDEIIRLMELVCAHPVNPVAAALKTDLDRRKQSPRPRPWPGTPEEVARWALVVRPGLLDETVAQWSHEPQLAVLTQAGLVRSRVFEHVYFPGPARRYSPAVLAAPPALGVTLLRYSFLYDEPWRRPLLQALQSGDTPEVEAITLAVLPELQAVRWTPSDRPAPPVLAETATHADVLPAEDGPADHEPLDWGDEGEMQSAGQSALEPELQVLSGEMLTRRLMIATEDGPQVIWIHETLPTSRLVTEYPPSVEATCGREVTVGDILLLRNEGTQLAYSRELARVHYGAQQLEAGRLLSEFKASLKAAVKAAGSRKQAVKLMVRDGADRSCTVTNLSSWITMNSLRPDSDATFTALLAFTGYTARRRELEEAITVLKAHHIQAGRRAGAERLTVLLKLDLGTLEDEGHLKVQLHGGTVSAHQVLDVAPIASARMTAHLPILGARGV